jgi:hypothetical protein
VVAGVVALPGTPHLFFLPIFATIRFFSIFFRRWANLVAGLRAVCRSFPAIVVPSFNQTVA